MKRPASFDYDIRVFGEVEDNVVAQTINCLAVEEGSRAVICADSHLGYSQPIGVGVAYREHISPSGVGYDIGCIAAGELVTVSGGARRSIEQVTSAAMCADATGAVRRIDPQVGVLGRGTKPVVRLALSNGRSVLATPDHQVRTRRGWVALCELRPDDAVLCPVFVGDVRTVDDPLGRLVGFVNGDGHIAGNRVACYSANGRVAAEVAADITKLVGKAPSLHVRTRPSGSTEHCVYITNRDFVDQLVAAGAVPGRKAVARWPEIGDLGVDLRSYLSAFASAEMASPAVVAGRVANLAIKQRGTSAAGLLADVFRVCGFEVGVSRSDGENWFVQLTDGEEGSLRFVETIGFCYEPTKRRAAARAASFAWGRRRDVAARVAAQHAVRERMGQHQVREAVRATANEYGLTEATVLHLAYRTGAIRRTRNWRHEDESLGECCWVPIASVDQAGKSAVYDLATADPAQSFIAGGVVVHNCGNKAVLTDLLVGDLEGLLPSIMDEVFARISFGMGRHNDEPVDHPVIDRIHDASFVPQRGLLDLARKQLGTVGAGNHYVDLFRDEQNRVWVGVHFGSRGFGHKTASGFLALAQGKGFGERAPEGEMMSPPTVFPVDSGLGQSYIEAMTLAGEYAYAGRDVVVAKVLEILGAKPLYEVHNHHNYAWNESHNGETFWVVRKGCTPAFPGQRGFVGATMGENAVILEGTDHVEDALASTVHGAGRAMSRTKAKGKVKRRKTYECAHRDCTRTFNIDGISSHNAAPRRGLCPEHPDAGVRKVWRTEVKSKGLIDYAEVRQEIAAKGIELRGGDADEAPGAYKRLEAVLAAHGDTIRVLHRLTPIGVAMASSDTVDPYKD